MTLYVQDGTLPLHCAAKESNAKSIQHLIDKGAEVDAVDNVSLKSLKCLYCVN